MTATDELRRLLDERGVEWKGTDFTKPTDGHPTNTSLDSENHDAVFIEYTDGSVLRQFDLTPEQAIAATLGREQLVDPVWEQWLDGLRHDEIKTIGDAVQQLMYESIEHGGDMGPNGNSYGGVDEGEVLTLGFINSWVAKFEALLGNDGVERSNDGVAERTTTRNTKRTVYGNPRPICEVCGYGIGDKRWHYCPSCGAEVIE